MKTQIVHVEYGFHSLGDLGIDAAVVDKNSRIDKVGLAFSFAAAQGGQDAVRLNQANTGLGQTYPVAVPKRELSADKIWIVEDRIEAVRLTVGGILIALREKE